MDQISEHQRDLTNSASSRFVVEFIAGFAAAVARMHRVVGGLHLDAERMLATLEQGGSSVLAEPAYILLALSGEPEAHEIVRRATLAADENGTTLAEELEKLGGPWQSIQDRMQATLGMDARQFFARPERYRGRAAERARGIADRYGAESRRIRRMLE